MPDDDVLARIDAALEALFPPDESLTTDQLESLLDHELDHETDAEPLRPAPLDLDLLFGIADSEVVFVERSTVEWIEGALPRVECGELDWDDDIPWVQRDQETLLPTDIVERYGTYVSTALDGPVVTFRSDDADAIVATLEERGARCERDDEAVTLACFG